MKKADNYYFIKKIKFFIIFIFFIFKILLYQSNKKDLKIILQKITDFRNNLKNISIFKNYNFANTLKKINNFENNLKNISLEEIQEFRKNNSENKIICNLSFKKNNYPEISVIVTSHNQAHIIYKCIRSIQNQSIKNLEIILIDDCSTDNSIKVIEEYQKFDERIILVKHDTNEGKIKSRSDGIRLAKGTFITIIDGDDALIHRDTLYNSLYIAKLGNLDIVEFKISYYINGEFKTIVNNYDNINITGIVYQPELRSKFFIISEDDSIRAIQNRCICAKLIRNEVFQQVLDNIGPKYTENFILQYEDTIMAVGLFQIAKSYYLMKGVGYYYSKDDFEDKFTSIKNKTCKPNNKIKDMDQVKLLQYLVEKTADNELEKQMLYHEIFSIDHYLSFLQNIYHNYEMVYEVLDPMIKCPFLTRPQKERLKKLKNDLIKKQNK